MVKVDSISRESGDGRSRAVCLLIALSDFERMKFQTEHKCSFKIASEPVFLIVFEDQWCTKGPNDNLYGQRNGKQCGANLGLASLKIFLNEDYYRCAHRNKNF